MIWFFVPLLIVMVLCLVGGTAISFIVYRKIHRYLQVKRQRDLALLTEYRARLGPVLSELLANANDVDQQSKFIGVPDSDWSNRLARICRTLIELSDSLKVIDGLLMAKDVKQAREVLLNSAREAAAAAQQLERMRRDEPKIETAPAETIRLVEQAEGDV